MPPKKDEAPKPKKKAEGPMEPCGCGVNTYRPLPKGKKKAQPIVHNPGCTFQRAVCDRYPHLPKCSVCEDECQYCCGTNPWCNYCCENRCKFQYKRDALGYCMPGDFKPLGGEAAAQGGAPAAGGGK